MLSAFVLKTCRRTWRSAICPSTRPALPRPFSTTGKDETGDSETANNIAPDELDDEFALDGFDISVDENEDLDSKLKDLTDTIADVTPELASDLVAKMVETATRSVSDSARVKGEIIPAISLHTISVLRASRISTNAVQAAGSELYAHPITKKVSATISIEHLRLSRPAEEALKYIAGPRVNGDVVRVTADKFPSQAENHGYAVSLIDRLVVAAKTAVGEVVDRTPLATWEDVVEEVKRQAGEELGEARSVSLLLGEANN